MIDPKEYDPSRPETWNAWREVDLDRVMRELRTLTPIQQDRWIRARLGHLLNRTLLAEGNVESWQRTSDRWRERYLNTAEGIARNGKTTIGASEGARE